MATRIGDYKGHPVLSLLKDETDQRPFTFGLGKARLILDNLEEIRKFVEDNKREQPG